MAEESATPTKSPSTEDKERAPPARSWSFQLPTDDDSSHNTGGDGDATADAKTSPRKVFSDRPLSEAERNLQNSNQVPLYKFVLTGGPCGGKTTGMARIYSFLRERGRQ